MVYVAQADHEFSLDQFSHGYPWIPVPLTSNLPSNRITNIFAQLATFAS